MLDNNLTDKEKDPERAQWEEEEVVDFQAVKEADQEMMMTPAGTAEKGDILPNTAGEETKNLTIQTPLRTDNYQGNVTVVQTM